MQSHVLHPHACRHFKLGRDKSPYPFGKRLFADFSNVLFGKSLAFTDKRTQCAHFLAYYHIVFLHETVTFCKNRQHIFIKLNTQQHNDHTAQIGKEKTRQL